MCRDSRIEVDVSRIPQTLLLRPLIVVIIVIIHSFVDKQSEVLTQMIKDAGNLSWQVLQSAGHVNCPVPTMVNGARPPSGRSCSGLLLVFLCNQVDKRCMNVEEFVLVTQRYTAKKIQRASVFNISVTHTRSCGRFPLVRVATTCEVGF